jgi:hypothetical protein
MTTNNDTTIATSTYGYLNERSYKNQHNNDIKSSTIDNRTNQGGMGLLNSNINQYNKTENNNIQYFGAPKDVYVNGTSYSPQDNIKFKKFVGDNSNIEK